MTGEEAARARLLELQNESYAKDDAVGWFERLYKEAAGDARLIPWADLKPNRNFAAWLAENGLNGAGKRAVVVGCGLGDDAEELARLGFDVTAFDVSETAIRWAKQISPETRVAYRIEDLFDLPDEWRASFDFVLEIYTVQALPLDLRRAAIENIAALARQGGQVLVIQRGRDDDEPVAEIPFPLSVRDLETFETCGLTRISFEDFVDDENEPKRRFRVLYERK